MRLTVPLALAALLAAGGESTGRPALKDEKKAPPPVLTKDAAPTAAAERTLSKALKAKVGVEYTDARLGDVLKEFAAQADMRADVAVMWSYGPGFPFAQKVSYACKDKPLAAALDELLTKAGGGLGYVVLSKDGDRRDGWVLLTTAGERGYDRGPATEEEEKAAAKQLEGAKKLIDAGKPAAAKPLLTLVATKYANTKVAAEARELLEKLGK